MIIAAYILKVSLCLAILLAIYSFVLEREKILKFNRFFLIVGLVIAHLIPLINHPFGLIKVSPIILTAEEAIATGDRITQTIEIAGPLSYTTDWTSYALWIYITVALLLMIRLALNILKFQLKRKKYPKTRFEEIPLVMTDLNEPPHSFLKHIYTNKIDFEKGAVKDDVLLHEATHVRQLHSLDIILINGLQTLGWINPLYYFYKRAIQVNHEYLADANVTHATNNIKGYQSLLLDHIETQNPNLLASNLNFIITKKRLQMMTKTTSKYKARILRVGGILTLFSIVFLFGEATAQENQTAINNIEHSFKTDNKKEGGRQLSKEHSINKEDIDKIIQQMDISHPNFDDNFPSDYPRLSKDEYFKNTTVVYLDRFGDEIDRIAFNKLNATKKNAIPDPPPPPPMPAQSKKERERGIVKASPVTPEPQGTIVYFILEGQVSIGKILRPAGSISIIRPGRDITIAAVN